MPKKAGAKVKRPIDIIRRLPRFGGYLLKKPGFAWHAARQVARANLAGRHLLSAVEYAVTYDCQASCEKCSARKMRDSSRPRLTDDQLRRLGDDVFRLGNYEVNLTGGEPLLEPRLEQIVSFFHPSESFVGINTNGAALTPERIRSLAEVGVDLFKISLDSPRADEHDRSRGIPGLHRHIFEMLRVIHETPGVRGHLCMVTTREQVEAGQVAEALALAKRHHASFGMVFPSTAGGWLRRHEVLLEGRHREALAQIARDPDVFMQGNLGDGAFRCPCGTTEIYITCYGEVIPCPFIQVSFGNVAEESFTQIYHRMMNWSELRGDSARCRGAEDLAFIERYNDPLDQIQQLPVRYDRHPGIKPGDVEEPR